MLPSGTNDVEGPWLDDGNGVGKSCVSFKPSEGASELGGGGSPSDSGAGGPSDLEGRLRAGLRADLEDLFRRQQEWLERHLSDATRLQAADERVQGKPSPAVRAKHYHAPKKPPGDVHKSNSNRQDLMRTFTEIQHAKIRDATDQERFITNQFSVGVDQKPKPWVQRLVDDSRFEAVFCVLILINAVIFGVEVELMSQHREGGVPLFFEVLDIVFTLCFLVEICLRLLAYRMAFFCSKQWLWNIIDVVIVVFSIAEHALSYSEINASKNLTYIRIIRTARIVRMFRVVRILKMFTPLRILVCSVLSTLRSLIWTLVLLLIILFLFAVLFTQAVAEGLGETVSDARLEQYYGSLGQTLATLFKCITDGVSWHLVSAPLSSIHPAWEGLFFLYIAFIYFAVFNVVTGVFCQSAIENAQSDKDMVVEAQMSMKQMYTRQLEDLFRSMDAKNTGHVTLSSIEACLQNDQVKAYLHGLDITVDDAWNLFKLLDDEETNAIDIEQFVTGCLKLRGSARSVEIHMLMYECRWMRSRITDLIHAFNVLADAVPRYDEDLTRTTGSAADRDKSVNTTTEAAAGQPTGAAVKCVL